jgi:putative ABC transport system permease protein
VNLGQYWLEAFNVLAANRARTILTALGLIIGVMAVIAIQVLGAGMAGAVNGLLGAMSERTFFVVANVQQADFTRAALRLSDLERMQAEVPNVVGVLPLGGARVRAQYGHETPVVTLGPRADERYAAATPLRFGRKIDLADIADGRHVCVISDAGYTKLQMAGDPTGSTIRVGEYRYTIVGILSPSISGNVPSITEYQVAIPYPVYDDEYVRGHAILAANVLLDDQRLTQRTENDVLAWLHRLKGERVRYQTFDRATISKSIDGIFTGVTLVVGLIGAVSLVVAGIGILNIMLVSVAERTREIGLRKAIGATRFQVLLQFFIEALALSAFGCLVGLVLGVGIGAAINDLLLVKLSGVVAPIPWLSSILIATGFATIVTLAFGTYPAWRAATLDPIEALRYE